MKLRTSLSELLIVFLILMMPFAVLAQETDRQVIEIEGESYLVFPEAEAVEILKRLKLYELQKEEIKLLETQVGLLRNLNNEKDFIITFLERDRLLNLELLTQALEKPQPAWHQSQWVAVGIAFGLVGGMYGAWNYSIR